MSDDEHVLGIWTVSKASWSKGPIAPRHVAQQRVAVTDERVCWFADELNEVPIDDVDRTDLDYVSQQAAPPMVMGGGLLFILGVFGSIGALFAGVGDVFVISMPALTGLAIFLGSRVVASMTGREGETRAGYRLTLWTDDDEAAIWGEDEATMEDIDEAIAGVRTPDRNGTSADEETADRDDVESATAETTGGANDATAENDADGESQAADRDDLTKD